MSSGLVVRAGTVGRASATGVADLDPVVGWADARFFGALMGERSLLGVDEPATLSGSAMVDGCGVQSAGNPGRRAHVTLAGNITNGSGS